MKIQHMGDLHLEFQENSRCLKHNELLIAGDVDEVLEAGFGKLSVGSDCSRQP